MSDVERVAAAMREADAELQVQPPDVSGTADHARRSLIRRLLVVGVLSALGATLLIIGGTAPAITHIRAMRTANKNQNAGKGGHDHNGGGGGGGKGGGGGGGGHQGGGGGGGDHKHHEQLVAGVGPGEPIAVQLPDLVVSRLTKTEVTVENLSPIGAEPFEVSVILKAEGQNTVTVTVPFEEGLEGESTRAEPFELRCESGLISAEVDPANESKRPRTKTTRRPNRRRSNANRRKTKKKQKRKKKKGKKKQKPKARRKRERSAQ